MSSILVVDDDADLAAIVTRFLESEGFVVVCACCAEEVYETLTHRAFDLVLLDINLPDSDGFSICRELRRTSTVPIIFASARTSETDRIEGLDTGGDDYLPKPYSLRELLSHINALLRRASGFSADGGTPLIVDPFEINETIGTLTKNGRLIALSPKEFALVCHMAKNPGVPISKERLVGAVWGAFSEVEPQTVSVHMNWLRAKLEDDPQNPIHFKTVRGKGYLFDPGKDSHYDVGKGSRFDPNGGFQPDSNEEPLR